MDVEIGCSLSFRVAQQTHCLLMIEPHRDDPHKTLTSRLQFDGQPLAEQSSLAELSGNMTRRFDIPAGRHELVYRARVSGSQSDRMDMNAAQVPVAELPPAAFQYLLPSRYCESDLVGSLAAQLSIGRGSGWNQVQEVMDWAHDSIEFGYQYSSVGHSAASVIEGRKGVCRDFAHVAIAICRALNIPARYVFGYLPDAGASSPTSPMDFCAWTEVYLGGRWHTFDPRNNEPRIGRVVVGRGRDAADVSFLTTFGGIDLEQLEVIAEVDIRADLADPQA